MRGVHKSIVYKIAISLIEPECRAARTSLLQSQKSKTKPPNVQTTVRPETRSRSKTPAGGPSTTARRSTKKVRTEESEDGTRDACWQRYSCRCDIPHEPIIVPRVISRIGEHSIVAARSLSQIPRSGCQGEWHYGSRRNGTCQRLSEYFAGLCQCLAGFGGFFAQAPELCQPRLKFT
jgi:hypothetical protein